jgi:hypothetical protein
MEIARQSHTFRVIGDYCATRHTSETKNRAGKLISAGGVGGGGGGRRCVGNGEVALHPASG